MNLFRHGQFRSHSGVLLQDKIDCDALTQKDWDALSFWFYVRLPSFGKVVGIPNGGLAFALAMQKFVSRSDRVLILDDVLTTGRSMNEMRLDYPNAIGAVLFARTNNIPEWITARFIERQDVKRD